MAEPVFDWRECVQGSAHTIPAEPVDSLADEQLVRQYRDTRAPGALTEMVRRHQPMVLRTCLRLVGNTHDAEDAAQSVFLALAQRPEVVRTSLAGCLHGLARAAVSELRRSRRRRNEREELAARMKSMFARLRGRAHPMEHHELGEELDAALAQLPDKLKQAVILRHLEGHSQQEAARRAGCTPVTMAWRSMKGLQRLRTILGRRGVAATAGVLLAVLNAEARAAASLGLTGAATSQATAAATRVAAALVKRSMMVRMLRKAALIAGLSVAAVGLGMGLLLHKKAPPEVPSPKSAASVPRLAAHTAPRRALRALGLFDKSLDIGQPARAGAAQLADDTYTVRGGGQHIYGNADQFRFVFRKWTGDGKISAHVVSDPDQDARQVAAGVMFRERLTAGSKHVALLVTNCDSDLKYRTAANAESGCVLAPLGTRGPHWVQLVRKGKKFTAYVRADGARQWKQVKELEVALDSSLYVGLAVTAHDDKQLATTTFDHVSVGRGR